MSTPPNTFSGQTLDSVSSSEAASLHGQKAKTPIIAGSICGGVMGLAFIIGFFIYFRKRYNRKKRKQAIAAGLQPPKDKKSKEDSEPGEKVVIPPDPAILMGYRPGERIPRNSYTNPTIHSSATPSAAGGPHTSRRTSDTPLETKDTNPQEKTLRAPP